MKTINDSLIREFTQEELNRSCKGCLCLTCQGNCEVPCRAHIACEMVVSRCLEYEPRVMPLSERKLVLADIARAKG